MEDFLPSETIRQGYARLMARCFSGDREVRFHEVVLNPETLRDQRGSAIRVECAHDLCPVFLRPVKALDPVVALPRPDACRPSGLPWGGPPWLASPFATGGAYS